MSAEGGKYYKMIHHFFEHHAFGETKVHLHADNCTGHNKNRFMIYYLTWWVMAGLHKEIMLSFLLFGHTKFAPDWCFGLLNPLRTIRFLKIRFFND